MTGVVALPPTELETTGRCLKCNREVAFLRCEVSGWPAAVHPTPQRVQPMLLGFDLDGAGAALTAAGMPAQLATHGEAEGYTLHSPACPVVRRRATERADGHGGYSSNLEPATPPPRPTLQTPSTGTCRRCRASMLWIKTAATGKNVPLDPGPITGVVLSKDQARELKGHPELVRGYNLRGEVVAIRRGYQAASPLEAEDTVRLAHHGTCPHAQSFRR